MYEGDDKLELSDPQALLTRRPSSGTLPASAAGSRRPTPAAGPASSSLPFRRPSLPRPRSFLSDLALLVACALFLASASLLAFDAVAAVRARQPLATVADRELVEFDAPGELPTRRWRDALSTELEGGWWPGGPAKSPWDWDVGAQRPLALGRAATSSSWRGKGKGRDGRIRVLFLICEHPLTIGPSLFSRPSPASLTRVVVPRFSQRSRIGPLA